MFRRITLLFSLFAIAGFCEEVYRKPPKEILDVLNAPAPPSLSVNPTRTYAVLSESLRYPPISEVAAPMLRLAGLRINPKTNGPHRVMPPFVISMRIKRLSDGADIAIATPPGAKMSPPDWSPDGKQFTFTNTTANSIDLWLCDVATGKTRRIEGVRLNSVLGDPAHWLPDNQTVLVRLVPAGRGAPPAAPLIPRGPSVQESDGHAGPVRTYEDMLQNPHDEDLFDYYAASQLAWVDTVTGKVTPFGKPALYQTTTPSTDGRYVLVARAHKPYSYLLPAQAFPKEVEVLNHTGAVAYKVASLPLEERVPIEGVPVGPRGYQWEPSQPATLVWVEALDGGNPREKVPDRDRVVTIKAPFRGGPEELLKVQERFRGLQFLEKSSLALVEDYERNRRWQRTFLVDLSKPGGDSRLIWERNVQDRYKDPGQPVSSAPALGGGGFGFAGGRGQRQAVWKDGDDILLTGAGASPKGDRPFLDRFNLATKQPERLFQCDADHYETVVAVLDPKGTRFITRRESPAEPPNYYLYTRNGSGQPSSKALTHFTDPTPELRKITKQRVTYTRPDGVPLSFTLYLPADYKPGTRLPTVVWAYPLEYNDARTAGQISGSTQRFTTITGPSELFFALAGYAILEDAAMPVIGTPETVNNTYVEQIVADAKAAIDKAAEMGVTDPERVGVGGHSYGAFMTANLLAHSHLFRAGVARSGAYNRTLTPFGFQSERRTLWEAPDVYLRMSPFMVANKIKEPILLIHGEADDNQGTFPIQSERMYQAIRGNGGTVRLVFLPAEAHGYQAKETIEDVLWEMIAWFDKYVKNAGKTPVGAP